MRSGYLHPEPSGPHSYASRDDTGRLSVRADLQNIPIARPKRPHPNAFIPNPEQADLGRLQPIELACSPRPDIPQLRQPCRRHRIHAMTARRCSRGPSTACRRRRRRPSDQFRSSTASRLRLAISSRSAREAGAPSSATSSASRHPDYMDGPRLCPGQRLCRDDLRPPRALPGNYVREPIGPRLQRARGHQRAHPGFGRRHYPPRHGAHGRRTRRRRAEAHADAASGS